MSSHYLKPLVPNNFYHILNRGINKNKIFFNPDNYEFFIRRLDHYLSDYLTIYAFCLLDNHFHLLVKLNTSAQIIETAKKRMDLEKRFIDQIEFPEKIEETSGLIISNQFRKFFMSYAKAINKQEERTGSLLQKNFERKIIDDLSLLNNILKYIHTDPMRHKYIKNFKKYQWSSYSRMLTSRPSKLPKKIILDNFGGINKYIAFHEMKEEIKKIDKYIVDY